MAEIEWALNLQNKAERAVFKLVDEKLRRQGDTKFFDIYLEWSTQIETIWKGRYHTSLEDGFFYEVTYNIETRTTRVDVHQALDSYVFPD